MPDDGRRVWPAHENAKLRREERRRLDNPGNPGGQQSLCVRVCVRCHPSCVHALLSSRCVAAAVHTHLLVKDGLAHGVIPLQRPRPISKAFPINVICKQREEV